MNQQNYIIEYFLGNVITNNENMSTKQKKLSEFLFSSFLKIRNLSDNDFGRYTCSAKNTVGNCSKFIKLYSK